MGALTLLAQIALFTVTGLTTFNDLITLTMQTMHGN